MVEIVDGLKAKLVEIDTKIDLLRREIGDLEDQTEGEGQCSIRIDLNMGDP